MSTSLDYQWPNQSLRLKIECFFEERLNISARLVPSGRMALSMIFDFLGTHRSHTIFAPKWSSNCVWSPIVARSNPTASMCCQPDYVLAVHKWGFSTHFSKPFHGVIIEDSVDSVFDDRTSIGLLGSEFDFISLPKILGSTSGAIVFSRNARFLEECTKYSLPEIELSRIAECLKNYELNLSTIRRRIEKISKHFPSDELFLNLRGRYPSNFPAPKSRYGVRDEELFMVRFFDVHRRLDQPQFEPCYLLPLHFGIDEPFFEKLLMQLQAL